MRTGGIIVTTICERWQTSCRRRGGITYHHDGRLNRRSWVKVKVKMADFVHEERGHNYYDTTIPSVP